MKKIDMHNHLTMFPDIVCPFPNGNRFLCVEEQLEIQDKLDIGTGVILPLISPECFWMTMSNEEAKTIADQHPDRFVWYCNVDPRMGQFSENTDLGFLINHYKELGARGVGELTAPLPADSPMMDNLFTHCEQLQMPVLIHIAHQLGGCYGIVDELGLPRIERMLKKHPDMKLIGHSPCFWSEISADNNDDIRHGYPTGKVTEGRLPKLLREYGNLYCDLSAGSGANSMMRDPEYAARFMEEFADRILYATDVCSTTNTFQYTFNDFLTKMVADGMLSRENYEKIVRRNAAKLLGLPE